MQGLTDTPPEIAEMVRARPMALSGAERFLMGVRMFEAARRMPLPMQKSKKSRRAGAGGMDSPQSSPKGEDAGKQPNQFVKKGAEVYAKA